MNFRRFRESPRESSGFEFSENPWGNMLGGDNDDVEDQHRDMDETENPRTERWVQQTLAMEERIATELGPKGLRKDCFGCMYSEKTAKMCSTEFEKMCFLGAKCVGQMSMEALGVIMARHYAAFRRDTNSRPMEEDDEPLPEWPAASIVDHLLHHNTDPEIQTWINLIRIQEMITIAIDSIVEFNETTGKKRIAEKGLKSYDTLVKLWYFTASRPLPKCFGYKKGKHIDVDANNQPFITRHGKALVDHYVDAQERYIHR